MAADGGDLASMEVDEEGAMEVVIKPRNNFTSNALKRAVPHCDLKKKKQSLTMNSINLKASNSVRLFSSQSVDT